MPEYLAPGVYVEEVSAGAKPIEGVSTSTAGFLGVTERGPEYPRLIGSFLEFQRWYGGYIPDQSYLTYAVQGFFDNGGKRCFVGRIANAAADASNATLDGALVVAAVGRGVWGDDITIQVERATQNTNWVRITITLDDIQEVYDNLTHVEGASNNLVVTINSASRLVRTWWDPAGPGPTPLTDATTALANGSNGNPVDVNDFTGNLDPIPLTAGGATPVLPPDDLLGRGRGLTALEAIDEISLLVVPDEIRFPAPAGSTLSPISNGVITQCETLKDRFAIVSTYQGASNVNSLRPPQDTTYAGFYYPWIKVFDPSINSTRLVPPTGHIAGIFARTDIERGVHKAPANEVVRGAFDMEFPITKAMQDILNPRGVNAIRDFRSDGRGIRLWGARTMSSDPEWKYVNVRRLFLFVEESVDEGTQWVVFEPNDEPTWAKVRRVLTNFLISVWRSGALMGTTQDEAFFVKCDRTTMTQDDIDNGRLICYIGIAPVKPAEFVIFRISQKTAEAPA